MARLKGLRWDKRRGLWRWPAEWDRPSLRPSVPLTTPTPTTPAGFRSLVGVRRMGTAGSTGYTLALDPATVTLTGQALSTEVGREVAAAASTVAVTGQAVTLRKGFRLTCDPASVALTGQAVTVRATRRLAVDPATVALAAQAVTPIAAALDGQHPAGAVVPGLALLFVGHQHPHGPVAGGRVAAVVEVFLAPDAAVDHRRQGQRLAIGRAAALLDAEGHGAQVFRSLHLHGGQAVHDAVPPGHAVCRSARQPQAPGVLGPGSLRVGLGRVDGRQGLNLGAVAAGRAVAAVLSVPTIAAVLPVFTVDPVPTVHAVTPGGDRCHRAADLGDRLGVLGGHALQLLGDGLQHGLHRVPAAGLVEHDLDHALLDALDLGEALLDLLLEVCQARGHRSVYGGADRIADHLNVGPH